MNSNLKSEYYFLDYKITGNRYIAIGHRMSDESSYYIGKVIEIVRSVNGVTLKRLNKLFVFGTDVIVLKAESLEGLKADMFIHYLNGDFDKKLG